MTANRRFGIQKRFDDAESIGGRMRAEALGLMIAISVCPCDGRAAEVKYQMDLSNLAMGEESQLAKPLTVEIKDRTWAAPGIEEALDEPGDYRRFRGFTGFWPTTCSNRFDKSADPLWQKGGLWPRTEELWGRGEFYPGFKFIIVDRN